MSGRWSPSPPPVVPADALPQSPPPHRVKVLHVITKLEAGAGGNTLLSVLGMDPRRYEVWVATAGRGPLWERAIREGVRTADIPSFRREVAPLQDAVTLLRLVRLMRRERFAIVHAHSAKAGFLGRVAAALSGVPVVVYTLHGRDPWWRGPAGADTELRDVMSRGLLLFRLLERVMRPVTHAFVAVSPTVARDAVLAGVATPGRVDVAPSAVDLDDIPHEADPSARLELGIPQDAPLVGTMGRLDAQKAPLDFVRMAALVAARRPGTRFVMVGDGELSGEARALAERLNVDILFTGFRHDGARIVSAFDVFVVSSLYEGVGRAVTEAMASGRPVAATAVDGVVDIVTPGATGLLARPRAPEELAACVEWLLAHPAEAARMGKQAREFVRTLFAPQRMCATLDSIYSALLGVAPTSPEQAADDLPAWAGADPALDRPTGVPR